MASILPNTTQSPKPPQTPNVPFTAIARWFSVGNGNALWTQTLWAGGLDAPLDGFNTNNLFASTISGIGHGVLGDGLTEDDGTTLLLAENGVDVLLRDAVVGIFLDTEAGFRLLLETGDHLLLSPNRPIALQAGGSLLAENSTFLLWE